MIFDPDDLDDDTGITFDEREPISRAEAPFQAVWAAVVGAFIAGFVVLAAIGGIGAEPTLVEALAIVVTSAAVCACLRFTPLWPAIVRAAKWLIGILWIWT